MLKDIRAALRLQPKIWELRAFGVILSSIGFYLAVRWENTVLQGFAVTVFLAALFAPRLLKYPTLAIVIATTPIGWIISRIILVIFFYLIVTPAALIRRITNHDTLRLRRELKDTYWEDIESNEHHDKMHL